MVADGLLSPTEVRVLADRLGLVPTKRRGQNFMIDPNTIRRIVRLAELDPGETVLEVGPGLGSLTLGLLDAGAAVIAVELDERLARLLPDTVHERRCEPVQRLRVITGDAMRIELPIEPSPGADFAGPTAFVANLPYNVAVPILLRVLAGQAGIQHGLILVQAEVADRLVAEAGTRTYGAPSVKLQWFATARAAGVVAPSVFWPQPRVESKLVAFRRADPPQTTSSRAAVFDAIDAAFNQRRKTIRRALAEWAGGMRAASAVLELARVDPAVRGEVLRIEDFGRISDARAALHPT